MSKGMKREPSQYKFKTRTLTIEGPSGDPVEEIVIPERRGEDINAVRKQVERLSNAFWGAYKGPCLIPKLPNEKDCDQMNNCHVIGEQFLSIITTNGHMYYWEIYSPYRVAVLTVHEDGGMLGYNLPWEIDVLGHTKVGPNQQACKIQCACHNHDHSVFFVADNPESFEPTDRNVQYRLGLRVMISLVALAEGTQIWARNYGTKSQFETIGIEDIENAKVRLTLELDHWLRIREQNSLTEIGGYHKRIRTSIRIAACGIVQGDSAITFATFTILPRKMNKELDLVLSYRRLPKSAIIQRIEQKTLIETIKLTFNLLSIDPIQGIAGFMKLSNYLFVCPEDYDNPNIANEQDHQRLNRVAAEPFVTPIQRFPFIPKVISSVDPL